jgi:hypothetical protein
MIKKKYGIKEPNRGENGQMASNITGEKITPLFDYGIIEYDGNAENQDNLKQNIKRVVEEVVELVDKNKELNGHQILDKIKDKFNIEKPQIYKYEDSVWHQFTKDERLGFSLQGFREVNENGKKIRIPHVAFSADLDYLDAFINRLVTKIKSLKFPD